MFENTTIKEFTELLASPSSIPGGGGASALVGAIGIALGDMVGEHTVGKKKYAEVEEELKVLMAHAQDLRARLVECVDKDAVAFEPLSKAYSIPKDEPGRDETLEKCLRDAAAVPMEIFDLCCEAIDVTYEFGTKGSKLMLSDAATGAEMLRAALKGAAVNVKVNTRLMKDREYAESLDRKVDEKLQKYSSVADELFDMIYNNL
jgi:formiminotetrahydrofolate cyclodeaminase